MKHEKYDRTERAEEVTTIGRRTIRDQVRLMMLFMEADHHQQLEALCRDASVDIETAENYLDAYQGYADYGLLPLTLPNADAVPVPDEVYEMWHGIFDPTGNDDHYDRVDDREGVLAALEEAGVKGKGTKALDVAKNPKSMAAAIIGSPKAAKAAAAALFKAMERNEELRENVQEQMLKVWQAETRTRQRHYISPEDLTWKILDQMRASARATYDLEIPEHMLGLGIERLRETRVVIDNAITVAEGRMQIENTV